MASEVHVVLHRPAPGALDLVRRRVAELERRWSRFIVDSELSRVVSSAGRPVSVSRDTVVLVATMLLANSETGGRYDPTMLSEILDAGYDTSIDDALQRSVTIDLPDPHGRVSQVRVDVEGAIVHVPAGLGLDPGGIGKGLAADLVVAELLAGGTGRALLSVGGDLVAAGDPPGDDGWFVHVEDPFQPDRFALTAAVDGGGVATSSTLSRRWSHRGATAHHVLDPSTRQSSRTDLATVTAIAPTGWQAEVHATAALVTGRDGAIDYLETHGCSGVAIDLDGAVALTSDLAGGPAGDVTTTGDPLAQRAGIR